MLSVSHLSKLYGSTYAVRDVSFEVARGEVVGFLGPNGAGKTTTLRMIAGFLGPSEGQVRIGGLSVVDEPIRARRLLGYMPEQCPAYPEMKVAEYLMFRAGLKGVTRSARRGQVADAMATAHVSDRQETLVGHLSKGYRQRLGLADALLGAPELLILDEPTAGLDPNQVREVRQVIEERRGRHTILVSTHVLSEVEATCQRALVIHRGQLVAHGTLDELRAQRRPKAVDVVIASNADGVSKSKTLTDLRGLASGETDLGDGRLRLRLPLADASSDAPLRDGLPTGSHEWVARLVAGGLAVESAVPVGSSLEDAFAMLTRADEPSTVMSERVAASAGET
jgi:ABC-2 type transport system ATP-binding protein